MRKHRGKSDADTFWRFMRLVKTAEEPEDCWEWQGNKPDGRYGHFSVDMMTVKAHRWIFAFLNGEIPDDLVVRHKCDNPSCVNPLHLEIGTHADNTRDKFERGRGADRRGEKHPLARLCAEQVLDIRRRASMGETQAALAAEFGVRRGQIGKIVNRINWRHV